MFNSTTGQLGGWDIRMSEERRRRKQAGKERGGRIGRGEGGGGGENG